MTHNIKVKCLFCKKPFLGFGAAQLHMIEKHFDGKKEDYFDRHTFVRTLEAYRAQERKKD